MSDMTPDEVKNDGPAFCIGRGAPNVGCGHTQPTWNSGVCVECGGMLFTARMKAETDAFLARLREAAGPGRNLEPPDFKSV